MVSPSEGRLKKKDAAYYASQRSTFEESFKANKFVTIAEALEAVNSRIVSLLTSDVKSCKLIGISRKTMEDVLKINPKVLARRMNAI